MSVNNQSDIIEEWEDVAISSTDGATNCIFIGEEIKEYSIKEDAIWWIKQQPFF